MDSVFIEELTVMTIIGVYDWEQTTQQKIVFDIEMGWDHHQAAITDDVTDCLNYAEISAAIVQQVEHNRYALLERVAEEVAAMLLQRFHSPWVRIKVSKPGAVAQAKGAGVIIERRSGYSPPC